MFSKPLNVSWPSPAKQQLGVKEATTATLRTTSLTLYFTYESRGTLQSFSLFVTVKTITKLGLWDTAINLKLAVVGHVLQRRNWSFHLGVLQSTAKKCTKNYNARAQPLFCSLKPLFSDVPVAVAVVVFLNSLM